MNRKSVFYRLTLVVIVLAVLGGGGYLAYRFLTAPPDNLAADYQKSAEQAYEEGKQSLDKNDPEEAKKAKASFASADILIEKALKALEADQPNQKTTVQRNEAQEHVGRLFWLKARVIRDTAIADALVDGKEMPKVEDSITLEKDWQFGQIPDAKAKENATNCVLNAAQILRKDLAVQYEALRLKSGEPYDLASIEEYSRNVLDIDPENVRAHWLLAQFDFKQPAGGINKFAEKKDAVRVQQARDHLKLVKAAPNYPIWRVLNLEADINLWLANQQNENQDKTSLYRVLFDPQTGALAQADRQERFNALNKEDFDAIIALHRKAIDIAKERARAAADDDFDKKFGDLFYALDHLATVTERLSKNKFGEIYRADLLAKLMAQFIGVRPLFGKLTPQRWIDVRDHLEKVASQAVAAKVDSPWAYAALARILNQDAYMEGKNKDSRKKEALEASALNWIQEGLRLADESKEQPGATARDRGGLIDLHAAALEVLVGRNAQRKELTPHFEALRAMKDPMAPEMKDQVASALADIQEAALLIREARLDKAQAALEAVIKNKKAQPMYPLALILLTHIYLTNDKPMDASACLRALNEKLQTRLNRREEMTQTEKDWFQEFLCPPEDIAKLTVYAELQTALVKFFSSQGTVEEKLKMLDPHENAARIALKELSLGTEADRLCRVFFFTYYARTGQAKRANEMFDSLKANYANHVDVLRFDVTRAIQPDPKEPNDTVESRQEKADALIKKFLAQNPRNEMAKRYWAEWLIRTGRTTEAVAYLNDPTNFPAGMDDATKRLIALMSVTGGNKARAMKMLAEMPKDDFTELLLIIATADPIEREEKLKQAALKYQNSGLLRLAQAEFLLAEKKPAEAAQCFWDAFDYSRVGIPARNGFVRAANVLSDTDPDATIKMIKKFSQEEGRSNEPALYSAAAYAAIKKGDFGSEKDVWESSQSMCAAFGRYQKYSQQRRKPPAEISLFKAQLWLIAQRSDLAWTELVDAVNREGSEFRNEEVLTMLIRLALDSADDGKISEAKNRYLRALKALTAKQANPDGRVNEKVLEARLLDRMGDVQKAVDMLEKILKDRPDEFGVYPILIQISNNRGDVKRAANWTAVWHKKQPDNPLPILEAIRQDIVAGEIDKPRMARAMKDSEDFVLNKVREAMKSVGDLDQTDGDKAKKEQVEEVRRLAWLAVAQTWQKAGKLDEALQYLERCPPNDIETRLLKAQIAILRKDWTTAQAIYQKILLEPEERNNKIARINLAWLLAEHGKDPKEALAIMRDMLKNPYSKKDVAVETVPADFLDVMGQVYAKAVRDGLEEKLPQEMLKRFEPASKRYPSDPRMFLYLGDARAGLKDKEMARDAYDKAIKLAKVFFISEEKRKEFIQKVDEQIKSNKLDLPGA